VSLCLQLQVSGGRPEGEKPAQLVVLAEGEKILEQTLPSDFSFQSLAIPVEKLEDVGEKGLERSLLSTTLSCW
jgi:hypothetical protein